MRLSLKNPRPHQWRRGSARMIALVVPILVLTAGVVVFTAIAPRPTWLRAVAAVPFVALSAIGVLVLAIAVRAESKTVKTLNAERSGCTEPRDAVPGRGVVVSARVQ